ncbi:MAG: ScpA family protein [Candidatus Vogelbacteria bacterium]|nr:ScpA family protein [Candidatus Vogelbacteria bacterium]
MDENFKIKVGEFEGPLDLLLNLIEKRKMHISQVSLAQVADDYVNFLKNEQGGQSMENMANFIMVASTLMLIKSLALLPGLQLSEEEKENVTDLEDRLKRLKKIRDLSQHVKERFGQNVIWGREEGSAPMIVFSPTREITQPGILEAIKRLIHNLPVKEIIPQAIIKKVISLEEVISDLAERVSRALKMSFSDFVKDKKDKVNIIISFLGMLELVKQGAINIEQKSHLAEIEMENTSVGVPRY